MLTDLIFDFYGTLVDYVDGMSLEPEAYAETHKLLVDSGYDLTYADFARGYAEAYDRLNSAAKATLDEFHMHDADRKSTRLNSSHVSESRMPSSA